MLLFQGKGTEKFGPMGGGSCTVKSISNEVKKLVGADKNPEMEKKIMELLPKYKGAADRNGIPWQYVAGIHKIETNNGRTPTTDAEKKVQTSSVGAVGPGQFMWRTWVGWTEQVVRDFPGSNNTPHFASGDLKLTPEQEKEITKVDNITKYQGEGVDADGDGYANPWNEDDAIEATAKKISKDAGEKSDFNKAILAYNHSQQYLNQVLGFTKTFANGVTFECSGEQVNIGPASAKVEEMIRRAIQEMPNIDYFMANPQIPPGNGRRGKLDCSGFVQWLYHEYLGIELPRTTFEQVKKGVEIPKSQLRPGDLVFFQNTYRLGVSHVGLYIGDGKFINAVGTGKGVKIEDLNSPNRVQHWHSARRYFE